MMCRFLAYLGVPVDLDKLLYEPNNSLVRQSYKALEREEPLNGDGFGIGWYDKARTTRPALFTDIRPAWSNRNLRSLATVIRSQAIFAHVRAASKGDVTQANCHPFSYEELMFMHNGDIGSFRNIKRPLRQRLTDDTYHWIQGETDSEHFFALFLDNLKTLGKVGSRTVISALEATIADVEQMVADHGNNEPTTLNVAITNGEFIVATRYVSESNIKPNTLYHSEGSRYDCVGGICNMVRSDPQQRSILVVSEKLTDVKDDWFEVPVNHFITVDENLSINLQPIKTQ